MYCTKCGTPNPDQARFCVQCGTAMAVVSASTSYSIENDAGMRMLLPVGRSGWAIAAGYAGLFSLLFFFAPIALILGIIGIFDIKKNPQKHGMGRCIFAVIMGALFTIPFVLFLVAMVAG